MFGRRENQARTLLVKQWVRESRRFAVDAAILVSELSCTEPGCPPLETVIAVLPAAGLPRQYKIHRPLAELTQYDVDQALAQKEHRHE